jgi:hypothetical protein
MLSAKRRAALLILRRVWAEMNHQVAGRQVLLML